MFVVLILGAVSVFQNGVLAQMDSPPDRPGATDNLSATGQPNEIQIPPAYQNMPSTPHQSGQDQQSPQSMEGVANQPPTLRPGSPQTGLTGSVSKDDSANLKSVREISHPLNDFLAVVKRTPTDKEREVFLYEILSGVASPARRRELLKAYWNLSEKLMHCHVRKAQRQRLEMVQGWMQKEGLPTDEIEPALQLVSQQYRALELEFIQTQYRFLDLQSRIPASSARWRAGYAENGWYECDDEVAPTPVESVVQKPEDRPLPIPADYPLAVPYHTKAEELQKHRTLSQKSLLLNHTIPLQYEAVVARTAARSHADNQWQTVLQKNRQSPVTQIETLAQEEMALISTIIEYNHQVDEYVIETFGANIPEKQLLASILVLPKPTPVETRQSQPPTTYSTYQPDGNMGR